MTDTIFALATPPGRGAIAVLRLSGPAVQQTLTALGPTRPKPAQASVCSLAHGRVRLRPALGRRLEPAMQQCHRRTVVDPEGDGVHQLHQHHEQPVSITQSDQREAHRSHRHAEGQQRQCTKPTEEPVLHPEEHILGSVTYTHLTLPTISVVVHLVSAVLHKTTQSTYLSAHMSDIDLHSVYHTSTG